MNLHLEVKKSKLASDVPSGELGLDNLGSGFLGLPHLSLDHPIISFTIYALRADISFQRFPPASFI
jgi:hypothetical protein